MSASKDLLSSLSSKVHFTNLEKVLYPAAGVTKGALLAYYAIVANWMLPLIAGRPVTIYRGPDGPDGECFFQKHGRRGVPPVIRRVEIASQRKREAFMVIDDLDGLLAAVQLGTLEVHTWGCRVDQVEKPDVLVFDFDPDTTVPWSRIGEAAFELRRVLQGLDLESWVRTTGGKGLHVVVPLAPSLEWESIKAFTRGLATALAAHSPHSLTVSPQMSHRAGRIYVDYLRNARGATAIASYSTRATRGATVATPISWTELEHGVDPLQFDVARVPERVRSLASNPWKGFAETRQTLSPAMIRAVESVSR